VSEAYRVLLVDRWGHVLERDGSYYRSDSEHPHFEARFAELNAAKTFCQEVVRELPHVACEVIHDGQMVHHHFDDEWLQTEEKFNRQCFAEQNRRDRIVLRTIAWDVAIGVIAVLAIIGLILFLR